MAAIPASAAAAPAAVQPVALPRAAWLIREPRGLALAFAATFIYGEAQRFSTWPS